MQDTRFKMCDRRTLETLEISGVRPKIGRYYLRLGLAHDFVTPNEPVTMRFICSHRRNVDDIVARNETQSEEATDEELSSS